MTYLINNPSRKNQILHTADHFNGHKVQINRGPLVHDYLLDLEDCITHALNDYSSVFVLRIDLKLPPLEVKTRQDRLIERFTASLSSKIRFHQRRSNHEGKRTHPTKLRYVWCKETSNSDKTHFHMALLLNKQAYWRVGAYTYELDNLYSLIINAWLSALGLAPEPKHKYLVHFTKNGEYIMRRDDKQSIDDVFHRLSYLCKLDTKPHDAYKRNFGCSRL